MSDISPTVSSASATTASDQQIWVEVISGNPTEAQRLAIENAVLALWPKDLGFSKEPARSLEWRRSGRWWDQGRLPSSWS